MGKKALVVMKEDMMKVPSKEIFGYIRLFDEFSDVRFVEEDTPDLFDLEFFISDRDHCETDKSLLQILPYVTVIDRDTKKIFTYKRGKAGNEDRLKGLHSIGLGGHVEEVPGKYASIIDVLSLNVVRELNEEIGIDITAELLGRVKSMMQMKEYQLAHITDNDVGHYHLCMWLRIEINSSEIGKLEDDVISKGQWLTSSELLNLQTAGEFELESWSKYCLSVFCKDMVGY